MHVWVRGGERGEKMNNIYRYEYLSLAKPHDRTLGQEGVILTFVRILSVIFVPVSWSNLAPVLQVGTRRTSPAAHTS